MGDLEGSGEFLGLIHVSPTQGSFKRKLEKDILYFLPRTEAIVNDFALTREQQMRGERETNDGVWGG